MKITELCQLLDLRLRISNCHDGYLAELKNVSILWRELWHLADNPGLQGGTTSCWDRGKDPNEALQKLCERISNQCLVIYDPKVDREYRKFIGEVTR